MKKYSLSLVLIIGLIFVFSAGVMAEVTVLEAWHAGTGEDERAIVDQAIERFEADNPGYEIDVDIMTDEAYNTNLQIAAEADALPDIFITWGGGPLEELVRGDLVYNVTPRLKEAGIYEDIPQAARNLVDYQGDMYGVPAYGLSTVQIWYNTEIFDQYGLEVPENLDEFKDVVQELRDNNIIPVSLGNQPGWPGSQWYEYLVYRLGGRETFEQILDGEASFEDEVFIRAGEILQELVEMGTFVEGYNALNYEAGESRALIYTEQAAMELMGDWWYGSAMTDAPDFVQEKIDFFEFPAIEEGTGDPDTIIGSPSGGNTWSIAERSEHKDAAFEFLTYLADEETSISAIEHGDLPAIDGRDHHIEDPYLEGMYNMYAEAPYVMNYWDQELPPAVGQDAYLTLLQDLYAQEITPEEFASELQEVYEEHYVEEELL